MLIYARNQTFCSKSVNKAPKNLIFGLNILCGILSNYTWKKCRYQNYISYVFYCFMNFLCISLFFGLFFPFFFGEICGRHCLKHNNAKTNSLQPLRVKISIFIWTMWKNSICIDFVHKITFSSHFRFDVHVQKSYGTSEPYSRALQIWCQNVWEIWKKKVIKCRRRELCALQSNRAKCRGGGGPFRPPQSF